MRRFLLPASCCLPLFCLLLLASCSTSRRFTRKIEKQVTASPVFNRAFTGFTLLDPETGKTLADVNGDKYFTPASNTKILTLATCLEVLGDSVPGLYIKQTDSSLFFRSTGDPTFLHPKFLKWQQIAARLKAARQPKIIWSRATYVEPFGPGWAWDDAPYDYSAERSSMPIFGNVSRVYAVTSDSLAVDQYNWHKLKLTYGMGANRISTSPGSSLIFYSDRDTFDKDFEIFVPVKGIMEPDTYIILGLLEDALHQTIWSDARSFPRSDYRTWYSTPLDTVLRRMMYQSDNFIAEQMLLVCAGEKFDTLEQDPVIGWMLDSVLTHLPQRPRWVDGSGLSRYNLVSPRDLAAVLDYLWKTQPRQRLFSLFNSAGAPDTTLEWYKTAAAPSPYLFAKTGSMSGVNCLSGYLVCKSGKVLIFSFMHNNYIGTNKPWKEEMRRILEIIRGTY